MPPDLNSLPPSRSMANSPVQPRAMQAVLSDLDRQSLPNRQQSTPSPRPRRSSTSLAAAASMNAADLSRRGSGSNRGSPRLNRMPSSQNSERRRSQIAINLSLNDPTIPSPGELSSSDRRNSQSYMSMSPSTIGGRPSIATGDPHHQRNPSLGEIHNELEQEQEMQVNRMLQMIREQQLQLDAIRAEGRRSSHPNTTAAAIDDLTPASERSMAFPSIHPAIPAGQAPPRRLSRPPSSANRSPALRPIHHESSLGSSIDYPPSPLETARRNSIRDESTFYQAETAALTRENQLLRQRIRELEKQIGDMSPDLPANTPATPSHLARGGDVEKGEEEASQAASILQQTGTV